MDEKRPVYSVPAAREALLPETPPVWQDLMAPLPALILSLVYWQVFAAERIFSGYGPGLGVPVFVGAYFAAVFLMLGKRPTADGLLQAAASLILALCCALYAHPGFTVLNCFVILLLAAMATFSLSGQSRFSAFELRAVPEAVRLSVLALFTRIDRPFQLLKHLKKDGKGAVGRVLLTGAVTLALLAVVLALLASADMVFGSFFTGIAARLRALSWESALWRVIRTIVLALLFASGLCFLREPAPEVREKTAPGPRRAIPFLVPAAALDIVYIIFCVIQVRYLFGGAAAAAMAGGWAAYARTGFFQLVAVACINLVLCLLGSDKQRFAAKGGLPLRLADGLMLLLTAVILASALRRMQLYIGAYGLSVLRLMTLWGMLVIAAGLLAAGWKLLRPDFRFWRVFFGFALGTWCLFCLANPAGRVADYNVDAYLDGRLHEVDITYLQELSADAAPALMRLRDGSDGYDDEIRRALTALERDAEESREHWSSRKLSCRNEG